MKSAPHAPQGGSRKPALLVAIVAVCCIAFVLSALNSCIGCTDSSSTGGSGSDGSGSGGSTQATSTQSASSSKVQTFSPSSGGASTTLKIASGSENKEAAEAIQHAVDEAGVAVEMHYMGSLDIMGLLQAGGGDYDAVWPASSIWITMGDTGHIVQGATSTSTTPVIFGVRKSKAIELGWADESGATKEVSTSDIISAVSSGDLSFAMTSATQSNSGASAYLAFLTALSGSDGPLSADDLADTDLTSKVQELLSGVDRSSGSSDWLKDMIVKDPESHQAMVNYESLVIQADKELEAAGEEPLLAIYPSDGIAISDSPLGYVDRGQGDDTRAAFDSFQSALGSSDAKLLLERCGRRCGLGGKLSNADDDEVKQAFRAEWGINTDASVLKAITLPTADVMSQALNLYQSELRKPSYTIWVVDYSGSMEGEGKAGVVDGLSQALDPELSAQAMIQPTEDDVNVLIPFSSYVLDTVSAQGSDTADLLNLAQQTDAFGGTDMYVGLSDALDLAQAADAAGDHTVSIVLMTDGVSMTTNMNDFYTKYEQSGTSVPIFSIMYGSADSSQLDDLAALSNGKVFDGRQGDLAEVFRQVKGYS
jgi:Ca-activated chloride channel family protein